MKALKLIILLLLILGSIYYLFNPVINSFYYMVLIIYTFDRAIDVFKVINNEL